LLGILGAALGTFVAGAFLLCAQMTYSQRYYQVPYPWKRLLAGFLVCVAFVVIHDRARATLGAQWNMIEAEVFWFLGGAGLIVRLLIEVKEMRRAVARFAKKGRP
jgi:H+/Cl- antiporter ClcA